MDLLQENVDVLNVSMDGTYKQLYDSNKHVDSAKTVILEVDKYVGDVANVKEGIEKALKKCDEQFEKVITNVDESKRKSEFMSDSITDLSIQLTKRNIILEDMENIFKQSKLIVDEIN